MAVESGGYPYPHPYSSSYSNPHDYANPNPDLYPYTEQSGTEDRDFFRAYNDNNNNEGGETNMNMYSSPRPAPSLPPNTGAQMPMHESRFAGPGPGLAVPPPARSQVNDSNTQSREYGNQMRTSRGNGWMARGVDPDLDIQ